MLISEISKRKKRTHYKSLDLATFDMNMSILRITNLKYSNDVKIKTILASLKDHAKTLNDENFKALTINTIDKISKIL